MPENDMPKLGRCCLLNKMSDGVVRYIILTEEQENHILQLIASETGLRVLDKPAPVDFEEQVP